MDKKANPRNVGARASKFNPMLKPFKSLVGYWLTIGEHPYLPGTSLTGKTSFELIEGGSFLMMRTEIDHPKIPDGIAIFGSDDSAGTYYMIYFDERGVSRKFDVAVTEKGFTWHRDDAHLSQRVNLDIKNDKLISRGEMSRDGGEWEKDLSLIYEKMP
jgi:hypothetical protein